jgi:osmotically-inducible protein OsmY
LQIATDHTERGDLNMKRYLVYVTFIGCILCLSGVCASSYASVPDSDINFWVNEALFEDPRIDASEVTTTTVDGIVTLSGAVRNLAAKKYADLETKKIKGVLGVINNIVVMPDFRFDTDIAQDVRHRIVNSSAVVSNNINVVSMNGKVTLTGEVDSWAEKEEAGLLASEVRGVTSVTNDLVARYKSKRSDREIWKDATGVLNRDVYLTGLPIDVSVKDGIITLKGDVGSLYEKERAGNKMFWLNDIRRVDNDLKVKSWENRGARKSNPFPTDSELLNAITAELLEDSRIDDSNIDIDVSSGHVTLTGFVPTYYQEHIAGEDANNIVGVGWVSNNLYVRGDRRDDLNISADIISDLEADDLLWDQGVTVRVRDGVATLSGKVNTWYDKDHASIIASRVRGVKRVVNNIKVERNHDIADVTLAKNIKDELNWDWMTFPVSNAISVKVEDGLVTLTGKVDTWGEYEEAEDIALSTDGISAVDNKLSVAGYDYHWDEWSYRRPHYYHYDAFILPES